MGRIKKRYRNKGWILPIVIMLLIMVIPSTWALYYSGVESNMTTTFKIDYDSVFVRAHILTYWEDLTSGQVAAKTSWKINSNIVNNTWTHIDDYYYYNGTFSTEDIADGIPLGNELISSDLSTEQLSSEDLTDLKNIAKYKIVYEFIEANSHSDVLSCEDAWGITYSETGIPSKVN